MTEKLASYKKKNKLMSGYQLKFTNGSLTISRARARERRVGPYTKKASPFKPKD